MTFRTIAEQIVRDIEKDILSRDYLSKAYSQISPDALKGLKQRWLKIILNQLEWIDHTWF